MTPEQVSYWLVFSPSHASQRLYLKTHDPWWHLWEWNNCTIFSSWLFAYLESCDEKSSQIVALAVLQFMFSPLLFRFLCFFVFVRLYAFIHGLFVCKHAKCSFLHLWGSWFSSCKCNALINPPSKTSSRQAVSINWGERQQGLILWREIPVECRVAEWGSSSEKRSQFQGNEWLVWFLCQKLM